MKAKKSFFLCATALVTAVLLMLTGIMGYSFAQQDDDYIVLEDNDVTDFYVTIRDRSGKAVIAGKKQGGTLDTGGEMRSEDVSSLALFFKWSKWQFVGASDGEVKLKYCIGDIIGDISGFAFAEDIPTAENPLHVDKGDLIADYWIEQNNGGKSYICVKILNYDVNKTNYTGSFSFGGILDSNAVGNNGGKLQIGDKIEYQFDTSTNLELFVDKTAVGNVQYDKEWNGGKGCYFQEFQVAVGSINGSINDVYLEEYLSDPFVGIYDLRIDGALQNPSQYDGTDLTIKLNKPTPGGNTSRWWWQDSQVVIVKYRARLKDDTDLNYLAKYNNYGYGDDGKNTVTAKSDTEGLEESVSAWMNVQQPYVNKTYTYDEKSKTITWVITVKPSELFGYDFTLSDEFSYSRYISLDMTKYGQHFGQGSIKVKKADLVNGEYRIEFETQVTEDLDSLKESVTITNKAKVKFDGIDEIEKQAGVTFYAPQPEKSLQKTLVSAKYYDPEENDGDTFTWEVVYTFPDTDDVTGDLKLWDNFYANEPFYNQSEIKDDTFKITVKDNASETVSFDVDIDYEWTPQKGYIIIHNSENYKGKTIIITYQTVVKRDNAQETLTYVSNDIWDNTFTHESAKAEKTVPDFTTHKSVSQSAGKDIAADWVIRMESNVGFDAGDLIEITDTLPEGLSFVEGSAYPGYISNGSFMAFPKDSCDWAYYHTGQEYTFSFTVPDDWEDNYIPNYTTKEFVYLAVKFKTELNDDATYAQAMAGLTNTASSTVTRIGEKPKDAGVATATFKPDLNKDKTLLDKGTTFTQADVKDGKSVPYTITVNSEMKQLTVTGKDVITLTDVLGSKLSLDEDSVKVYEYGIEEPVAKCWTYQDKTLTFTLKDKTAYTITYSVEVDYPNIGETWNPVDYSNTATMMGFTSATSGDWVKGVSKGDVDASGGSGNNNNNNNDDNNDNDDNNNNNDDNNDDNDDITPVSADIPVTKKIEGRNWKDGDSFTFNLSLVSPQADKPVDYPKSITIKYNGEADGNTNTKSGMFENIVFHAEGTYTFKITESNGAIERMEYDGTEHTVTVTVGAGDDGKLVIQSVLEDKTDLKTASVLFTNTYTPPDPKLSVKKTQSVNGGDPTDEKLTVKPGDTVTYYITVENIGNVKIEDVVVTDVIPEGLKLKGNDRSGTRAMDNTLVWNIGDLEVGAAPVTVSFTVTVPEISEDTAWKNIAAVSFKKDTDDPEGTDDPHKGRTPKETNEVEIEAPELNIRKTQSVNGGTETDKKQTVKSGDKVTYYLTVTNTGKGTAKDVVVTDKIPEGLEPVEDTISDYGELSEDSRIIVWNISEINAGAEKTVSFTVKVPETDDDAAWTNAATVSYKDDPEKSTDSNKVEIEKLIPKLSIKKTQSVNGGTQTESEKTVNSGDTVTYCITVKNTGKGTAMGVVVTDVIPAGLVLDGNDRSGARVDGNTLVWNIGELASEAVVKMSFTVTVPKVYKDTAWNNIAEATFEDGSKKTVTSNEVVIKEKPAATPPANSSGSASKPTDDNFDLGDDGLPSGDMNIPDNDDNFNLGDDGLPSGDMNIPDDNNFNLGDDGLPSGDMNIQDGNNNFNLGDDGLPGGDMSILDPNNFDLGDDGLPRGDLNLSTGVVVGGSVGIAAGALLVAAAAMAVRKRRYGRKNK